MMFTFLSLLFIAGAANIISADTVSSNFANTFYLGFLKNYRNKDETELRLDITTNCTVGSVHIQIHYYQTNTTQNETINCNSQLEVRHLPQYLMTTHTSKHLNGIRIQTLNSSQFISVRSYSWQTGSIGEYLGMPCSDMLPITAPKQYEYYLISFESVKYQHYQVWSQALVIGCKKNTRITIAPSRELNLPQTLEPTSEYITVGVGESHSLLLNPGSTVYIGKPASDITGTRIVSSEPLTVLSGHECASVPVDSLFCEELVKQIPPTMTWGREFFLSPFLGKEGGQFYKIVTSQNLTIVNHTCSGSQSFFLRQRGDSFLIFANSTTHCCIRSNRPILVAQIATSSSGNKCTSGDPFMIIIQPVEQYLSKSQFRVLSKDKFKNNSIGITTTNHSNVLYDGTPIKASKWTPIMNANGTARGYSYHFSASSGSHSVVFTNGKGTVVTYGFDCNQEKGYGFPTSVQLKLLHLPDPRVYFINGIQSTGQEEWQYSVTIGRDLEAIGANVQLTLNISVLCERDGEISFGLYPVRFSSNTSTTVNVTFNVRNIIGRELLGGEALNITATLKHNNGTVMIEEPSIIRRYIQVPFEMISSIVIPSSSAYLGDKATLDISSSNYVFSSYSSSFYPSSPHTSSSMHSSITSTSASSSITSTSASSSVTSTPASSSITSTSASSVTSTSAFSFVPSTSVSSSVTSTSASSPLTTTSCTSSSSSLSTHTLSSSSSLFSQILTAGSVLPTVKNNKQLFYFLALTTAATIILTIIVIILLIIIAVMIIRRKSSSTHDVKMAAVNPMAEKP